MRLAARPLRVYRPGTMVGEMLRVATAPDVERLLERALEAGLAVVGASRTCLGIPEQDGAPAHALAASAEEPAAVEAPLRIDLFESLEGKRQVRYVTIEPSEEASGGSKRTALIAPIASARQLYGYIAFEFDPIEAAFVGAREEAALLLGATMGMAYENTILRARSDANEAKYKTLVEQIPAVTYYRPINAPGTVSYISPQIETLFGIPQEAFIDDPDFWRNHLHPEDRERVLSQQATYRPEAVERPIAAQYRIITPKGDSRWIENYAHTVLDAEGKPSFVLGVALDITEAKEAEQARRRSEAKLRHLFDANIIGIFTGGLDGSIREANDAFLALIGRSREELDEGALTQALVTPPEWAAIDRRVHADLVAKGVVDSFEKELLRIDGRRVPVLVGIAWVPGTEDECIAFVVDLSERKRLEAQLRQGQKLEAIGRLAGGVAHDFNNLLAVVLGYAELEVASLPLGTSLLESMTEIIDTARRGQALTSQLLAFSKGQRFETRVVSLRAIVDAMESMIRRLLGANVELRIAHRARGCVKVDVSQTEQVVLNLVVNARDALPHGGRVSIETFDEVVEAPITGPFGTVEPGAYVRLSISDDGIGMDEHTLTQIFEPFFSTKGKGKGTGLGLSTVFGIVHQSGGNIRVDSRLGDGTRFDIYFPRSEGSASSVAPSEPPEARASASIEGWETVLIADDEDATRRLFASILTRHGYRVLEAHNAGEALLICERQRYPIHLLLTDIVMPHMSGPELWERVAPLRPAMKVLYTSGYADPSVATGGASIPSDLLLTKPFKPEALLRRVRAILDSESN